MRSLLAWLWVFSAVGAACINDDDVTGEPVIPVLTGLSPSSVEAGWSAFTLLVAGTGFDSQSVLLWNGSGRPTRLAGGRLVADITVADVEREGSATVRVSSPGGQSDGLLFEILPPRVVSLEIVAPAGPLVAGQPIQLRAIPRNGANRDISVLKAGCVQWASADPAMASVSDAGVVDALAGGSVMVTASCDDALATITLLVDNPVPAIMGVSPALTEAGMGDTTLTVAGSRFVRTSVVRWAGADRVTRYVSATELHADITAADFASTGTAELVVFNPAPGGGESGDVTVRIAAGLGVYSETPPFLRPDTAVFIGTFAGGGGNLVDFDEDETTSAEGTRSLRITMRASGTGFVGFFIGVGDSVGIGNDSVTRDMSAYSGGSLRFWARSPVELEIGIRSGDVPAGFETSKVLLSAATNFMTNDQWQQVCIPLASFTGSFLKADLSLMKILLTVAVSPDSGGTLGVDATARIDDARWDRRPCGQG